MPPHMHRTMEPHSFFLEELHMQNLLEGISIHFYLISKIKFKGDVPQGVILMEIHWLRDNGIDLDFIFILFNREYLYQYDDIWTIAIHLLWLIIWLGVVTLWLILIFVACSNPINIILKFETAKHSCFCLC